MMIHNWATDLCPRRVTSNKSNAEHMGCAHDADATDTSPHCCPQLLNGSLALCCRAVCLSRCLFSSLSGHLLLPSDEQLIMPLL